MNYSSTLNIENRSIALLGSTKISTYFYMQFYSILNIEYIFVTNLNYECFSNHPSFENSSKIKCIPLSEGIVKKENMLIVLCVEHMYREEYDKLLFNKGFEWGKDYTDFFYVVQYCNNRNRMDLRDKKIWIFGAGKSGKNFYEENKSKYCISGFISNYEEEKELAGLPVIRPNDILKRKEYYIIICSDAGILMAKQLNLMGLSANEHYSFKEMLPKKLFIGIGTCQIAKLVEVLSENEAFCAEYHADIYCENAYTPNSDADNKRLKGYGIFCDVVFYQVANSGAEELRNYKPIIDEYYEKAIKIFIPFYYFNGQLMQATNSINKYALKPHIGGYFWFNGDQEINRMVENNYTADEIFAEIMRDDYWSKQKIVDNFKEELKKIAILDRLSSFPIKEYIENNYQTRLIFIDGTHLSYSLCLYIANKIAKKLNITPMQEKNIMNTDEYGCTSIMPVYPCVIKALEMNIGEVYQFYNIQKNALEYIDIQEHVRRYIQYVMNVKNILEKTGTIMAW